MLVSEFTKFLLFTPEICAVGLLFFLLLFHAFKSQFKLTL